MRVSPKPSLPVCRKGACVMILVKREVYKMIEPHHIFITIVKIKHIILKSCKQNHFENIHFASCRILFSPPPPMRSTYPRVLFSVNTSHAIPISPPLSQKSTFGCASHSHQVHSRFGLEGGGGAHPLYLTSSSAVM